MLKVVEAGRRGMKGVEWFEKGTTRLTLVVGGSNGVERGCRALNGGKIGTKGVEGDLKGPKGTKT